MRIALLTYRGNMYCGGQGIYAAYLAREWKKAGHEVHVIAGPPLPEVGPDIPLHVIPNENVFGLPLKDWARQKDARALLSPVNLWELGVSRIGVFPEMQTFGLRLFLRWKELHEKHRFDVVFDNQCLSWGLLGIRALGVPVVSVIHHPLHIDREADFAIDPRLIKKVKRTLYFPLFMQQRWRRASTRIVTVSEASRRRDRALLRHPREGGAGRLQRHRCRTLPSAPGPWRRRPTSSSSGAPRTGRRASARCSRPLPAARARDAQDRRRPHPRRTAWCRAWSSATARRPRARERPDAGRSPELVRAVLDRLAHRRGALLLRGLRLPGQRGDGLWAARDRQRGRRPARGRRQRRQRGAARAAAGRPRHGRRHLRHPLLARAGRADGQAARGACRGVFRWSDAAAHLVEVFGDILGHGHRRAA